MKRIRVQSMVAAAMMLSVALAHADGDRVPVREAFGRMLRKVQASGRAEAVLERIAADPMGSGTRVLRGRIALEPPDRADIRFPASGERITVRGDGGEWMQPALHQMIRLSPERAAASRRWWALLVGNPGGDLVARRLGPARYLVVAPDAPGDSAWVSLDRAGLPSRLEIPGETEAHLVYRFGQWRFRRPRGAASFTITAPRGYDVVSLP